MKAIWIRLDGSTSFMNTPKGAFMKVFDESGVSVIYVGGIWFHPEYKMWTTDPVSQGNIEEYVKKNTA